MSETYDNNCSTSAQARAISQLSPDQVKVFTQLVLLYQQPDTPERQNAIAHWWHTVQDRLTDDEYRQLMETKIEVFKAYGW